MTTAKSPNRTRTLADVPEPEPELDAVDAYRATTPFPAPSNVVQALANVLATVGGVPKLTTAQRRALGMVAGDGEKGVPWAYRGIDQMTSAAQQLLGYNGVLIVPSVNRATADVTTVRVGSSDWLHVTCDVVITVYGPGGVDDKLPEFTVTGEARDNSDKVWAKVQTAARKQAILALLQIGDPKHDPDLETHPNGDAAPAAPPVHPDVLALNERIGKVSGPEDNGINDRVFKGIQRVLHKVVGDTAAAAGTDRWPAVVQAADAILASYERELAAISQQGGPGDDERIAAVKVVYMDAVTRTEDADTGEPVPALVAAGERAKLSEDEPATPTAATTADEWAAVRDALDEAWAEAGDLTDGGTAGTIDTDAVLTAAATTLFRDGVAATMDDALALVRSEQAAQDAAAAAQSAADADDLSRGEGY
jgi:hypothetical protein